jgi:hypothetical protein
MGAGKPADGTDACLLRRLLVAGERTAASRRERVRVGGRGESRAEEAASRMGARAVVREGRAGRMGTQWISA